VEENAYIGGIVVGFGYLIAGVRLYRLSLQTHKLPERILAATLLLWGLAYACWQLPFVINDESAFQPLYIAGRFLTDAGTIASVLFLRLVFRPGSLFATALVAGITIGLVLGVAGSAWVGDWESIYPLRNPWWWVEWGAVLVSMAWMGIEGLHHYAMSKLRRKLGLCTALTCNRYLLWGLTGTIWAIYELVYAIQQIEFDATGSYSGSFDVVASTLEIIPIVCIWLVFFPPDIYRRWIERSDLQPEAAEG
jgi:hypothetical protein